MEKISLVLTNPYAYEKGLNRALELATEATVLKVIFLIDLEDLDKLIDDLGQQGWLGLSSQRNLRASMLDGYRTLASDVIQQAKTLAQNAGVPVETAVVEVCFKDYIEQLLENSNQVIVSASTMFALKLSQLTSQVELIEEG